MPLYEYSCTKCGKTAEFMQKFSDKPKTKCPSCGGKLEKLFSAPAFHLKGTGWYKTDFAHKKTGKSTDNAKEEKGGKPAASTDAKPEKPKKTDTAKD